VGRRAAEVIAARLGTDGARFPTAGDLASWAGLCPGEDASAGEWRGGETTPGGPWSRTPSVQAAWAARRPEETILSTGSGSWAERRGERRAPVAVARRGWWSSITR
jgi:transposase